MRTVAARGGEEGAESPSLMSESREGCGDASLMSTVLEEHEPVPVAVSPRALSAWLSVCRRASHDPFESGSIPIPLDDSDSIELLSSRSCSNKNIESFS